MQVHEPYRVPKAELKMMICELHKLIFLEYQIMKLGGTDVTSFMRSNCWNKICSPRKYMNSYYSKKLVLQSTTKTITI